MCVDMLLNIQWVKGKTIVHTFRQTKRKDNTVLRGNSVVQAPPGDKGGLHKPLHTAGSRKEERVNPKASARKGVAETRLETNDMETGSNRKTKETKGCALEKINKTDEPLTRPPRKKERGPKHMNSERKAAGRRTPREPLRAATDTCSP